MSRLTETKRAFNKVTALLDQEIRKRTANSKDLENYRAIVEIAFYVLAFGQFEYLVKREATGIIDENAALKTLDGRAWKIVQQKGDVSLRKLLDLIYHADQKVLKSLNESYTIRNDSVHGNQMLPKEAKDVALFIQQLEVLVDSLDK
jgi:hypothetical protein